MKTFQSPPVARDRLLRLDEVMQRVGMRTTLIYKLMREGRFPRSIPLGVRTVAWPESAIDAWVTQKIQAAMTTEPPANSSGG